MKKCRFLLGYGSETGQSKSIAQGIFDIALEKYQICADVFELDEVDKQVRFIERISIINRSIAVQIRG